MLLSLDTVTLVGGELGTPPAPWLSELEGTDCEQGPLLSLEEILCINFLSVIRQKEKRL